MASVPSRRSSRPRSGKSALELLGVSPRRSSSVGKKSPTPPETKRSSPTESKKSQESGSQAKTQTTKQVIPDKKTSPEVVEQDVVTKRGRGRPRKRPIEVDDALADKEGQRSTNQQSEPRAKRRRGRPAHPDSVESPNSTAVDASEETDKSDDYNDSKGSCAGNVESQLEKKVTEGISTKDPKLLSAKRGSKSKQEEVPVVSKLEEQPLEKDQVEPDNQENTVAGSPGGRNAEFASFIKKSQTEHDEHGEPGLVQLNGEYGVGSANSEQKDSSDVANMGAGESIPVGLEQVQEKSPGETQSYTISTDRKYEQAENPSQSENLPQSENISHLENPSQLEDPPQSENPLHASESVRTSEAQDKLAADGNTNTTTIQLVANQPQADSDEVTVIQDPQQSSVFIPQDQQVVFLENIQMKSGDMESFKVNKDMPNIVVIENTAAVPEADTGDDVDRQVVIPVEISELTNSGGEQVVASTEWMTLTDSKGNKHIKVKVKQGTEVIPVYTRRSQRAPKPTEKKRELTESLLKLYESVKPKDVMLENIIAWGDADGRSKMKCKHCHVELSDREDFEKHLSEEHSHLQLKPWQCPVCYYRVSEQMSLKQHMAAHTQIKQYTCNECGHMFGTKAKLNQHMKYHRDIRDQECPLCDRAFHEYKTLNTHLLQVHKTTKLKALRGIKAVEGQRKLKHMSEIQASAGHTVTRPASPPQIKEEVTVTMATEPVLTKEEMEQVTQGDVQDQMEEDIVEMPTEVSTVQEVIVSCTNEEVETAVENMFKDQEDEMDDESAEIDETDTSVSKRTLPGTYKTKHNTEMFKLGLSGAESKPKLAKKEFPRSMIKPEAGIAISKKGRWINNQRYVHVDQMEPAIKKYADIFPGDIGVRVVLKCKLCGVSWPSKSQFISHLENEHSELKPWECDECNYKTRKRTSLIVHKKLHSGEKEYECQVCNMKFAFKQKLTNHMKHHENKREHVCDTCGKGFNEKCDLTKHIKRVHMCLRPFVCKQCNKAYKESTQLKRHLETHSGVKNHMCPHCNKYYLTKISLSQHMKSHTCMFHCEICQKSFGSYSGFMAHKVMHDESYGGYKCDICGKTLHTKGSLMRHQNVAHSDDRPFVCEICLRGFKTKRDLKNHKMVHSDAKEFPCTVCDYKAKRIENLRVHMRRHATTKPFKCGVCGRDYTQRRALELHLRHHVTTGHVDSKTCIKCGTAFQYPEIYKEHIQTCQGKTAMTVKDEMLEVEVETSVGQTTTPVTGEQHVTVFMCEECNSVFATQDSLAVHILAEHMKHNTNNTVTGQSAESQQTVLLAEEHSSVVNSSADQSTGTMPAIISVSGSEELAKVTLPKEQYVSLVAQNVISSDIATTTSSSHYVTVTDPATAVETIVPIDGLTHDKQVEGQQVVQVEGLQLEQKEGQQILVEEQQVESLHVEQTEGQQVVLEGQQFAQLEEQVEGLQVVQGEGQQIVLEGRQVEQTEEQQVVVDRQQLEQLEVQQVEGLQVVQGEGQQVVMEGQ